MDFTLPPDLVHLQEQVRQFVREELQPVDAEVEATGQVPERALAGLKKSYGEWLGDLGCLHGSRADVGQRRLRGRRN